MEIICETATCVAFYDGYPVSPGHALIIPKWHVASYFDLTNHEREAMNVVLQYVKQKVDERYHPDGYNIGINVNEAAGQSVFHPDSSLQGGCAQSERRGEGRHSVKAELQCEEKYLFRL